PGLKQRKRQKPVPFSPHLTSQTRPKDGASQSVESIVCYEKRTLQFATNSKSVHRGHSASTARMPVPTQELQCGRRFFSTTRFLAAGGSTAWRIQRQLAPSYELRG